MTEFASRHFVAGDRPLRRDIRLLGWQVRRLVREHGGEELWDTLHHLRGRAEARVEGDADAEAEIAATLTRLPTERLAGLTRAVGLFFDLANLAEDRHRVRVLRQRAAEDRLGETIAEAAASLKDAGVEPAEARRLLERLEIEPVLTAHPTEAKRRNVRRALRRLRQDLYHIDRPDLLPRERRDRLTRMQRDLSSLWYSDPISPRKPTVMEELGRTLFAVRTIWRIGPQVMQALREAFAGFGELPRDGTPPLRFGNWIGGDRDGNPYVTTAVTRRTLAKLRQTAVRLHRRQCRRVRHRLAISSVRAELPRSLKRAIDEAVERWPWLRKKLERLHPDEWAVQWLAIIDARLRRSAALPEDEAGETGAGYRNSAELTADVQRLIDCLHEAGHDELTHGSLRRWRDRLTVFGLHVLRLDLRVNSTSVRRAVRAIAAAMGGTIDFDDMGESDLERCLSATPAPRQVEKLDASVLDEEAADLLALLEMVQRRAGAGGGEALGQVIISMTHRPSDVLAMLWLMRLAAARAGTGEPAALPIVPLFETIDDLNHAETMLATLLSTGAYRDHVRRCGERQVCMLGYSDSAKDGGYLASNWALHQTQRRLAERAQAAGVALTIFHGRGGTIGRGGGPAARAILSLPREAVNGRLRVTEQGEVIAERYDDPAIARRHLEQLFWATLKLGGRDETEPPADADRFAETLAGHALDAYRRLTDSEAFAEYLRHCTALPLVEKLPIGSRPSRRSASAELEDLRAIPYTFAWNQVRIPLNAFYGLGAAYDALDEADQRRAVELYRDWPWFRAVIDNAELALARCEPSIARRYVALAPDPDEALGFWRQLRDEHDRARRAVLAIKRQDELLDPIPWLKRTIRVRNPYVDILNLIQVELMSRRAAATTDEAGRDLDDALRTTVQAIAAGLRNTG